MEVGLTTAASVAAPLEGCLLKDPDTFPYFMLLAFESSAGLLRFAALLSLWPILWLLRAAGMEEVALRVTVFVAVAGVREADIKAVARAVLPKFFMDDVDMEVWGVYSGRDEGRRVVTGMPRLMVEQFVKEHLNADEVVGRELRVSRSGIATGWLLKREEKGGDERGGKLGCGEWLGARRGSPAAAAAAADGRCEVSH